MPHTPILRVGLEPNPHVILSAAKNPSFFWPCQCRARYLSPHSSVSRSFFGAASKATTSLFSHGKASSRQLSECQRIACCPGFARNCTPWSAIWSEREVAVILSACDFLVRGSVGLLGAPHADSACGSGALVAHRKRQPACHSERSEESLILWLWPVPPHRSLTRQDVVIRAVRRLFGEGSGCHSERSEESRTLILWLGQCPRAGQPNPFHGNMFHVQRFRTRLSFEFAPPAYSNTTTVTA